MLIVKHLITKAWWEFFVRFKKLPKWEFIKFIKLSYFDINNKSLIYAQTWNQWTACVKNINKLIYYVNL